MTTVSDGSGSDEAAATEPQEPAADKAELALKYDLLRRGVTGVCHLALILGATVPLMVVRDMIESVAGQTTTIDANVVFSFTMTASLAVNAGQWFKSRSQRAELKRQRAHISHLEARLNVVRAN